MFVVVGATGNTGSAVVETLLNKKQVVRIVVRSADKGVAWKTKGADVAVASLDDVSALAQAFAGAMGVYLMVPPNYGAAAWLADQQTRMDRAVEAVKKSEVGHVVYLSSVGGQLASGTGPIRAVHYGEGKLEGATKHLTISAPSLLYGELGAGHRSGKGPGGLTDVHCSSNQDSDDFDKRYRSNCSGAAHRRWTRETSRGAGWSSRIQPH